MAAGGLQDRKKKLLFHWAVLLADTHQKNLFSFGLFAFDDLFKFGLLGLDILARIAGHGPDRIGNHFNRDQHKNPDDNGADNRGLQGFTHTSSRKRVLRATAELCGNGML